MFFLPIELFINLDGFGVRGWVGDIGCRDVRLFMCNGSRCRLAYNAQSATLYPQSWALASRKRASSHVGPLHSYFWPSCFIFSLSSCAESCWVMSVIGHHYRVEPSLHPSGLSWGLADLSRLLLSTHAETQLEPRLYLSVRYFQCWKGRKEFVLLSQALFFHPFLSYSCLSAFFPCLCNSSYPLPLHDSRLFITPSNVALRTNTCFPRGCGQHFIWTCFVWSKPINPLPFSSIIFYTSNPSLQVQHVSLIIEHVTHKRILR